MFKPGDKVKFANDKTRQDSIKNGYQDRIDFVENNPILIVSKINEDRQEIMFNGFPRYFNLHEGRFILSEPEKRTIKLGELV